MKRRESLEQSMIGALNKVSDSAEELLSIMDETPDFAQLQGIDIKKMRACVESITQKFHEASAYYNALFTD